jgi:hypothetical protein
MNRTSLLLAMGLACQAALFAQTQPSAMGFQRADSLAAGRGGRGINIVPLLRPETGKPFSAMVTTQTTQTLVDGTHVSQTTTMLEYRDADGRTRTEPEKPVAWNIEIRDPVAGVMYGLNPGNKFAVKIVMPATPARPASPPVAGGRGGRSGGGAADSGSDKTALVRQALQELNGAVAAIQAAKDEAKDNGGNVTVEDLGTLTVNGVPARGTRVTTIVPVGAIGNDKQFRSVSERWFSPDLNVLIRSISTDPRFGTTTYELTNISRQAPDPSLFQVPADYRVIGNTPIQPPPAQPASKVIEGIEFQGVRGVAPETLRGLILSKVGEVYSEETLRSDFSALWKTGRFSDVQVKTEPGARGGVIIRFEVTQR